MGVSKIKDEQDSPDQLTKKEIPVMKVSDATTSSQHVVMMNFCGKRWDSNSLAVAVYVCIYFDVNLC